MSEVANIYDNGPISPIARINENLTIYTQKKWQHFRVIYEEPYPRGSQLMVDMVALAGVTQIAANGTIPQRVLAFLQPVDNEFLHLRWEPIDDMEGVLWEQSGTARFQASNTHARITRFTHLRDPYLATSTFWVLGRLRDMNLEVRNPNAFAWPIARFVFFGYRYVLSAVGPLFPDGMREAQKTDILKKLAEGDKETVLQWIGPTTWVPAEGRPGGT